MSLPTQVCVGCGEDKALNLYYDKPHAPEHKDPVCIKCRKIARVGKKALARDAVKRESKKFIRSEEEKRARSANIARDKDIEYCRGQMNVIQLDILNNTPKGDAAILRSHRTLEHWKARMSEAMAVTVK